MHRKQKKKSIHIPKKENGKHVRANEKTDIDWISKPNSLTYLQKHDLYGSLLIVSLKHK